MKENIIYELITIIKYNGNIFEFINKGYALGQVVAFLDSLKTEKYVACNENGQIYVTTKGEDFISKFENENDIKKYSRWVLPRREKWKKPIKFSEIYIPKK